MDNTQGWSPEAWAHPATDNHFNLRQIIQLDPRPAEIIVQGLFDVTAQDRGLHLSSSSVARCLLGESVWSVSEI